MVSEVGWHFLEQRIFLIGAWSGDQIFDVYILIVQYTGWSTRLQIFVFFLYDFKIVVFLFCKKEPQSGDQKINI